MKWSVSGSVVSDSLQPHGLQFARLLCSWNSLGKNTGVGCHSLLQGIFLTQGLNPGLPYCRQFLYHLSHQGSPYNTYIQHINQSVIETVDYAMTATFEGKAYTITWKLNIISRPCVIKSPRDWDRFFCLLLLGTTEY